ncbi:MAG: hypothetical protein EBZ61_11690 [Micrococcales bacterium]|nr:hypothetical protein [Micrococcales bacterium]
MAFDVNFDLRLDSKGKDPDKYSPTLKAQHQLLWSKLLPNGSVFQLELEPKGYLKHVSKHGVFHLSSDTISHSLRDQAKMLNLIKQIPNEKLDYFQTMGSVIGARTIFPGNRIDGRTTINQRRGMHNKINDRFDLTLECIRLHYENKNSPLADVLGRYSDFFRLFCDFTSYVEFFLLQDLVSTNSEKIDFFLPHDPSFTLSPRPESVDSYYQYMENSINFVKSRNERIQTWVEKHL